MNLTSEARIGSANGLFCLEHKEAASMKRWFLISGKKGVRGILQVDGKNNF